MHGKRSNYHWNGHDRGIGDDHGAVHPVSVHWWEHDEELGHIEALEFVQTCFIELVTILFSSSPRFTKPGTITYPS